MPKSYTVTRVNSQLQIRTTHFAPGYTPLHTETPGEAVVAYLDGISRQMEDLKDEVRELVELASDEDLINEEERAEILIAWAG